MKRATSVYVLNVLLDCVSLSHPLSLEPEPVSQTLSGCIAAQIYNTWSCVALMTCPRSYWRLGPQFIVIS